MEALAFAVQGANLAPDLGVRIASHQGPLRKACKSKPPAIVPIGCSAAMLRSASTFQWHNESDTHDPLRC